MFERYALASRKAVYLSCVEARKRGASEIDGQHLALGVLAVGERVLGRILRSHSSSVRALRADIEAVTPSREANQGGDVDLPLSPIATKALVLAERERSTMQLLEVQPGHLVAAILQAGGPSATVLAVHGVTLEAVRSALEQEFPRG